MKSQQTPLCEWDHRDLPVVSDFLFLVPSFLCLLSHAEYLRIQWVYAVKLVHIVSPRFLMWQQQKNTKNQQNLQDLAQKFFFRGTPGLLPVTSAFPVTLKRGRPISTLGARRCRMRFLVMSEKKCSLFKFQKQLQFPENCRGSSQPKLADISTQ